MHEGHQTTSIQRISEIVPMPIEIASIAKYMIMFNLALRNTVKRIDMKKNVMIIVMMISSIYSFSQKIEKDYYEGKVHVVVTEWEEVEDQSDKRDIFVKLIASQEDSLRSYSILFQPYSYANFSFNEGSKLLVKTMSDEVLTLTCFSSNPTYKQRVQIFMVPTVRYYCTVGYNIKEEELIKMITGTKKLRFEVTGETFQYEYKKDKIGKYLKKAKENVDKALLKSKNFEDDF